MRCTMCSRCASTRISDQPCGDLPFSGRLWNRSNTMLRAFSLIELLAAVAVIAILAAILIPVIGLARDSASQTRCLNNLRQFGIAAHNYALNHAGVLPPCNMQNPSGGSSSWPWKRFISEFLEKELTASQTNQWDPAVMRCPVYRSRYPNIDSTTAWYTGYGMNTRLLYNKTDNPRNERQSHNWTEATTNTHPLKGYICGFDLDPIRIKERRMLFMCGYEHASHFLFPTASSWNAFNISQFAPNPTDLTTQNTLDASRHRKRAPVVFVSGRTAALNAQEAATSVLDPVQLAK